MNYDNFRKDDIRISRKDLKQLVFWAEYGVQNAMYGSYQKTIIPTILKWGKFLEMRIKQDLRFGKYFEERNEL